MPDDFPHVPAAFINNIAEEGTKEEAIQYLQKTWDELCYTRELLKRIQSSMEKAGFVS